MSTAALPYSPSQMRVGPEFYLSFPYPWNAVPQARETTVDNIIKVSSANLPKFNGNRRVYITWRNSFIPGVHLAPMDVSYKIMLLRSSMDTHTRRMKEFVDSLVGSPEGYRQAIITLEERYGGSAALLMSRQEDIMALPEVKEGDFGYIETLHVRLKTYLLEWQSIMGAPMTDRETITFYTMLMGKLEPSFALRYVRWTDTHRKAENLHSLQQWLGEQLKHHRQVNVYVRSRGGQLGRVARGGGEAGRANPGIPSSQLDRNYKKGGTFFGEVGDVAGPGLEGGEIAMGDTEGPSEQEEVDWGEAPEPTEEQVCVGQLDPVPGPGTLRCPLCQADHGLGRCSRFREMTPQQRKELLAKERRCYLCFQRGHTVFKCSFKFTCAKCGRKHHTLLHGAEPTVAGKTFITMEDEEVDVEGATEVLDYGMVALPPSPKPEKGSTSAPGQQRVSLRTVPVLVENPHSGRTVLVNAMLDDGCTGAALVSRELALELKLQGEKRWTQTEGVGGHVTRYETIFSCVRITHPVSKTGRSMLAQVMDRPAGSYQPVDWNVYKAGFDHLKHIDFPSPIPNRGVDVMLGNQCATLAASLEEVMGREEEPVARRTALGWTAVGPVEMGVPVAQVRAQLSFYTESIRQRRRVELVEGDAEQLSCTLLSLEPSDKQMVKLLEKLLAVEEMEEAEVLSPREQYIVQQAQNSLVRVGHQYQVGCTWAPGGGRPPLGLQHAVNRLNNLERGIHFAKREVRAAYQATIRSWEESGFVKRVLLHSDQVRHLLPHFPILKESESTPVRPVMDCSVNLNKHLLAGPNLLNEVVHVLLRFRSGLYSFSGDVRQMFLRILLPPEDRPFHCFLWREGEGGPLVVFQFQVHVFGNAGSPFLAVFVVKEHARRYQQEKSVAVETLMHSTLIDDVLDSVDSEEEAQRVLLDVRSILADAGMQLAKAHSNSLRVLEALKKDEVAQGVWDVSRACNADAGLTNLKTLGLRYSSQADHFLFEMETVEEENWTKRAILKVFPRLFDPLGLVLPFAIVARRIFSVAAKLGEGWDAPLPIAVQKEWREWTKQLPSLPRCVFPRCIKRACPTRAELHVFADASNVIYAAAAYLRCSYPDQSVTTRLVLAKAHVVPAGKLSVPRMELMAADLAVKLRRQVLQALKVQVDTVFHWSDSLTVLYWLRNDKNRLQLFVYNKVSRIQKGSDSKEWRWVPSGENPADLPTRGLTVAQLADSSFWREGPRFLCSGEQEWPNPPRLIPSSEVLKEMRKEQQIMVCRDPTTTAPVIPWERFSSWDRLQRMMSRIWEWRDRARKKLNLPALGRPWLRAEESLLRQVQLALDVGKTAAGCKEEWRRLGFARLTPFKDERGLWRGTGRLSTAAALPRDAREPLLLPKRHPGVTLLLRHLHEKVLLHSGGVNYVLGRLHARFWLPGAREQVFRLLSGCVPCRRRLAQPRRPPEGPLPEFRLPDPGSAPIAFRATALDCAGPFRVKRGRSYETHYLLLLTCCQTRAVRLEGLTELSVDAFLLALTRATSRGVHPHMILSDNGGNFEGANRLLRALWQALPQEKLQERMPQVQWRFNPPYASHYGGVFERLVGAAKSALYHVLPSHLSLSWEQLLTAFAVVEGILNARPLAYTSSDAQDYAPLTPNHFLYGSASTPLFFPEANTSLAKKWGSLQSWTQAYLEQLERELRPHLQLATKTRARGRVNQKAAQDLQQGDVVTFLLPSSARMWPLARITKVFPGKDGRVRTVELLMPQLAPGQRYLRSTDKVFRRDAGAVALLLPASQVNSASSI